MDKDIAKRLLESYELDYQYYFEKSKAREKIKEHVLQAVQRVKRLGEYVDGNIGDTQTYLEGIMAIQAKEEDMLIDILRKKQKIDCIIEKLDSIDRTIIYMRYTQSYTFEQIASKLHYSVKRIYQLHAIALENFAASYDEEN